MIPLLKQLQTMKWQLACSKTSMDPSYVPKFAYTDRTANGLTRCIIDFLTLKGHQAERVSVEGRVIDGRRKATNVMGQFGMIGSVTRIPASGKKGSADISAIVDGRPVKIEIKMKDKQSDAQLRYQAEVERAGGIYWVVRSYEEFMGKYLAL